MSTKMNETDLYKPIKNFFINKGYTVNGEVIGCDITAIKEKELIIIELKKSFNIKLLYQAIDRQRITGMVYLGIPRPLKGETKNFNKIVHIVRKLNLGLITVALDSPTKNVEIIETPQVSVKKVNKKKSRILKEINGRNIDINKGGSNKVKLATAFRERCIHIGCVMEKVELISPSKLIKDYNCSKDTGSILLKNFYGWFIKESRGVYRLSPRGKEELNSSQFKPIVEFYRKKLDKKE